MKGGKSWLIYALVTIAAIVIATVVADNVLRMQEEKRLAAGQDPNK